MPAFLAAWLVQYILPTILSDMVSAQLMPEAEKLAVLYGIDFGKFVENLKTYHEQKDFPSGRNGQ